MTLLVFEVIKETRRLSSEWHFFFTSEPQRCIGCAEETITVTHVLINDLITQHVFIKQKNFVVLLILLSA